MKKIKGLILALCVLLTATGCNNDSEKDNESSSSHSSPTTSAPEDDESSEIETTVQNEQSEESVTEENTTEENTTEENSKEESTEETTTEESTTEESEKEIAESETQILHINRKTMYESELSEEYGIVMVESECSSVLLDSSDAEQYPELAAVLKDNAKAQEESMKAEYDMLTESAMESLSLDEQGYDTLVSTIDAHVRRADDTVLSILYDSYYYNGMNDGNRSFWGGNYDTKTGKEIYLPDVVTDMNEFAKVVEAQLFRDFGADIFYSDTIIEDYFKEYGADGTHWTMEYNGVTVYFSEGEIANSGVGAMSVTVEFAEYPELFKEKYTDVPEAYIVGIPMKSPFRTDLDGDGSCDEIILSDSYDEEFAWNATLTIATEEADYNESFPAYGCEPYYVKTADGKHYIYLLTELETQYELYTYAITNTTISKVGEQTISPYYNDGVSSALTDPDNMHFDIFGNADVEPVGDDFFTVGADGMPVMK